MKLKELRKYLKDNGFVATSEFSYEKIIDKSSSLRVTITKSMDVVFDVSINFVYFKNHQRKYYLSYLSYENFRWIIDNFERLIKDEILEVQEKFKVDNSITNDYTSKIGNLDHIIVNPIIEKNKDKKISRKAIQFNVDVICLIVLIVNFFIAAFVTKEYDFVIALALCMIAIDFTFKKEKKG